jgi:hypothetical protein
MESTAADIELLLLHLLLLLLWCRYGAWQGGSTLLSTSKASWMCCPRC